MAITLKSPKEIALMKKAGRVVADVLSKLQEIAKPGVTTAELDSIAQEIAGSAGADNLFKGVPHYGGGIDFPGAICASVNEQVVHGIPSEKVVLADGDILSIDYGVRLNGYCGDSALTVAIGDVSAEKQKLMRVTSEVLDIAVKNAKPGIKWSWIASKMQQHAESAGFGVVRDLVGHGIGREMHEEPQVPNYADSETIRRDFTLTEGLVIAVEPMINTGTSKVKTLKDGWTIVTKDKGCSAHYEHTIAIIENGCMVLTARE